MRTPARDPSRAASAARGDDRSRRRAAAALLALLALLLAALFAVVAHPGNAVAAAAAPDAVGSGAVGSGAVGSDAVAAEAPSATAGPPHRAQRVEWLRDPGGGLGLDDAVRLAARGGFQPAARERLNFGLTRDAIWLRVELRNDTPLGSERLLEIDYPYLDEVDFHVPAGRPGGPLLIRTGDSRPFATRSFEHRNFVLPVSLAPGESTEVFVRVRSSAAVQVPLHVRTAGEFAALEQLRLLLIGSYFGVAAVLVLYASTLRRALREPAYLAYFAFVGLFALFHFALNGFAYQYLWPGSPHLGNVGAYLFLGPAVAAATQFARSFLGSAQRMPRLDRTARTLIAVLIALVPATAVFEARWVALLSQALALVACGLGLAMGMIAWRAGYQPARWYLLAFVTVIVTGTAMVLRNLGLLPWNLLTAYGTQIGASLEALFLGLALSERIRTMARETLAAQQAALDASLRAGQDLESQVAERTAELAAANDRLRAEVRDRERAEALLRESEERLRRIAQHDPLTGAANRNLLAERSASILASARRHGRRFGVVALDLDDFKQVNDLHGHGIGDRLLAATALRLAGSLRASDLLARVGGDEFVVLLPDIEDRARLQRVVAKLRRVFGQPLAVPGGVLEPRASFGSALFPEDGEDVETLIRHADLAMYEDKQARRARPGEAPDPAPEPA